MTKISAIQKKEQQFVLQNYERYPLAIASGRGSYVFDPEGRSYLDLTSGLGVNAFGYAHPRILAVMHEQIEKCIHTSNLVFHSYQGALAEKLCEISGLDRVFFCNSGTEAMEAALKAARSRGAEARPQRMRLVALEGSFHGRTTGSLAITGQPALRQRFEPLGADVTFVRANDGDGLRRAICNKTAAVILEPVLGEGGIYPLDFSFLRLARELTAECGALLVADETQCGLGRTGKYFAYQWAGIHPDVAVIAKPLAAGLPLGATLFTEQAARFLPPHSHGTTFGGGPLACRVALEFLSMMDEALPRISEMARYFRSRLECLKRHSMVTEIRFQGFMFGIHLSQPGRPYVDAALERGLLVNCTQEMILRLLPPYLIEPEEIDDAVRILDEVLEAGSGRAHLSAVSASPLGYSK